MFLLAAQQMVSEAALTTYRFLKQSDWTRRVIYTGLKTHFLHLIHGPGSKGSGMLYREM